MGMAKSKNKLALFVTVYDRPKNLAKTLDCLNKQTCHDFDLFIVNNGTFDVESLVDRDCTIIDMGNKYRHFGRYFAAKEHSVGYEIVLFLDDDIMVDPHYIEEAYKQFDPGCVKSFWAFRLNTDYWDRKQLTGDMEGHYCGGGGLLAPAELFTVPELYECPEEYWIMDDIWLSHVILAYTNYRIKNFKVLFRFLDDSKATYKKIRKEKSDMSQKYLIPYL